MRDLGCRGAAIAALVTALIGCQGHDRLPDSGVLSRCADLENQLLTAIGMRGTCFSDDDCMLVAGEGVQSCNCTPYMIDCGGLPIERNAPGVALALDLQRAFFDSKCDQDAARPKACDCAPRGPLHCEADHRCTANVRSCLMPPPPDAGFDAAVTSAAAP